MQAAQGREGRCVCTCVRARVCGSRPPSGPCRVPLPASVGGASATGLTACWGGSETLVPADTEPQTQPDCPGDQGPQRGACRGVSRARGRGSDGSCWGEGPSGRPRPTQGSGAPQAGPRRSHLCSCPGDIAVTAHFQPLHQTLASTPGCPKELCFPSGVPFLPTGASLPPGKPFRSPGARRVGRAGLRLWGGWPVCPAHALSPTLGLGHVPTSLPMRNEDVVLCTDSRPVRGRRLSLRLPKKRPQSPLPP